MNPLVTKFNDLKRCAAAEISRIRQKWKLLQSSTKEEVTKLKTSLADAKEQLLALRDDNNRKAKLMASMKIAKNSEDSSVEQVITHQKS